MAFRDFGSGRPSFSAVTPALAKPVPPRFALTPALAVASATQISFEVVQGHFVRTEGPSVDRLPVGVHQRRIDHVLANKPDLHLVGANHAADEQIIGAVVA